MGRDLQGPRVLRRADRLRGAPLLAEHRLPRGRPPGGDGRSRLVPGPLSRRGQKPAQGLGRGAHGRAHHLYVGRCAPQKVRAQSAGSRQGHLRLRRRFPGGKLSAPSGLELRRPVRRQLLSLHHPRHGLFRPGRGPWRRAGQRLPGNADAVLSGLLHQRLAVSDRGEPGDRARAERGRRQCQLRRAQDRQGHDSFLLHEPELFDTIRGFLGAGAVKRGIAGPNGWLP